MNKLSALSLTTALVLGLAACGGAGEVEPEADTGATEEPAIELTTIQEANFERTNRAEFVENYDSLRDELAAEGPAAMPSRTDMDFAFLDHNEDGKLNPAEYALIGASTESEPPMDSSGNPAVDSSVAGGEAAPASRYLGEAEIEETLREFFSHDQNGDSFLSESEFADATAMAEPEDVEDEPAI